jgi:hypothetical protein
VLPLGAAAALPAAAFLSGLLLPSAAAGCAGTVAAGSALAVTGDGALLLSVLLPLRAALSAAASRGVMGRLMLAVTVLLMPWGVAAPQPLVRLPVGSGGAAGLVAAD